METGSLKNMNLQIWERKRNRIVPERLKKRKNIEMVMYKESKMFLKKYGQINWLIRL